jgi:hypothetical protein
LEAVDEAGNMNTTNIEFSIYTSDFGWNWPIISEQPKSVDFTDENGTFWFTCILASKTSQFFNLTFLESSDTKLIGSEIIFGLMVECERSVDIIYISLSYPINGTNEDVNQSFSEFQWIIWDEQNGEWEEVETKYNQVLHSWDTTFIGFNRYFALIETGTETKIKSVELGGGQIPAFEYPIVILAICSYYGITIRRKQKKGEKSVKRTN